ncbi:uncharacterized protein SCHCODRAFT_01239158 [Schizophyllum commune H4-8]|uniref:uncharacterized protein n=1 Tax=Schizophyllum commune (strain H4-8 / FGSC 9210) TaxID=578458 RepID=UPI002160E26D|nr:uncharacterized protein SCHCODRAFT_01239158 [Schizophyllum commune H4-8]KAI5887534.1 hypothetical protein SCHCODRAFT_01239158 [Schizophyllum commune H4-8]
MSSEEPTLDTLKGYKEGLIAAANARDKAALLNILHELDVYSKPPEALGPSLLGLTVGKLRYHETEEVSERAKALVARWMAAAPARKRQESLSTRKSTQISQQEGLRRSGSNVTRRLSAKRTASSRQPSNATREQTSASTHSDAAPKENMGPPLEPVSRGRTLARDDKKKASASASLSTRNASQGTPRASEAMSVDRAPSSTPPTRSFATDDLGDASSLHDVPLRALTIELLYDALASGAGDMPSDTILPLATAIEDGIYLGTGSSEDAYVGCAHLAFIALSAASTMSTMRRDLLAGIVSADDFVDQIVSEASQGT